MRILGVIFLTVGAAPAAAQFTNCSDTGAFIQCFGTDGTITNCSRVGTSLNCSSMGGPSAARAQAASPPTDGDAANGMASLIRSIGERRARSRTTKALQAGDCATATRDALGTGNMVFAQQVQAYCNRQ